MRVMNDGQPNSSPLPGISLASSSARITLEAGAATNIKEQPQPMLDVHPVHDAARTWKDFLIHIATISVGLLIAIGLEQSVEYWHHRHQVAETREALRAERESNVRGFAETVEEYHRQGAALINNIIVLRYIQQHPGTEAAKLPGILLWHAIPGKYSESAWKTAQQSDVTALMPQDEVRQYAELYAHIEDVEKTFGVVWPTIVRARLYGVFDPDPTHLTPAQIDEEIEPAQSALASHFTQARFSFSLGASIQASPLDRPRRNSERSCTSRTRSGIRISRKP
jgi:hypothetical protein